MRACRPAGFCTLIGRPARTRRRWQAKARAAQPPKGPWPRPVRENAKPVIVVAVEPTQAGSLQITENPTGAFANSPDLPFHLLNLTQYMNISPQTLQQSDVFGTRISATGQGSGSLGLPGDYSPPSRFVRAAFFSANHPPLATTIDGVEELFHLLNAFDIPMGVSRVGDESDFTQLTVVRDSHELTYSWRSYADQRIRQVNMRQLRELAKTPLRIVITPITGDVSTIDDVTGQLIDSPVAAS